MTTIKENLRKALGWSLSLLPPRGLQAIYCLVSSEAHSARWNLWSGLTLLMQLQDALKWYIDQQAFRYDNGIHPKHLRMNHHRFLCERSTMVRFYGPKSSLRMPMRNRHWEVPLKEELGLFSYSDPTHCTEYTLDSFTEEVESAGLAILFSRVVLGKIWAEVVPSA